MRITSPLPLLLLCCSIFASAQSQQIDSLKRVLSHCKEDTAKANVLNELGWASKFTDPDSALKFANCELELSKKLDWKLGVAKAENLLGCLSVSDHNAALGHFSVAMDILRSLETSADGITKHAVLEQETKVLTNTGLVYSNQSKYPKALECFFKVLKMNETFQNHHTEAAVLGNIGIVYEMQGDYERAREYYDRALKIFEQEKNQTAVSIATENIGNVYFEEGNYPKALEYYLKALALNTDLRNTSLMGSNFSNIGSVYVTMEDYPKALEYYFKATALHEQLGDITHLDAEMNDIGSVFAKQHNAAEAKKYFRRSLDLSEKVHDLSNMKDVYQNLTNLDSALGNYRDALDHYKKYISMRDSITNDDNIKNQTRMEMNFEFSKKQAADSVKVAEEKKVAAAELKSEQDKRYSLYGGLVLVVVFAGFMYNRFRVTKKQKAIIEEQKLIVEEQKKIDRKSVV